MVSNLRIIWKQTVLEAEKEAAEPEAGPACPENNSGAAAPLRPSHSSRQAQLLLPSGIQPPVRAAGAAAEQVVCDAFYGLTNEHLASQVMRAYQW